VKENWREVTKAPGKSADFSFSYPYEMPIFQDDQSYHRLAKKNPWLTGIFWGDCITKTINRFLLSPLYCCCLG
jgi:hypothetical protein